MASEQSRCIIQICREINRETRGTGIYPTDESESRDRIRHRKNIVHFLAITRSGSS